MQKTFVSAATSGPIQPHGLGDPRGVQPAAGKDPSSWLAWTPPARHWLAPLRHTFGADNGVPSAIALQAEGLHALIPLPLAFPSARALQTTGGSTPPDSMAVLERG